ncbi:hypothetical protein MCSF7_02644 [Mycoplasmopsis columbina SF7]|uniref:Uncharacterized protein n=1 Tax=Mycoplasmopsis columbina SF7 TaxID=1037410 RepID=F9UJ71_9BACT|nr:hypothetical protein [Mycoplasmopsis columbina]EGV00567.1 hypothetical protein MCSF7_02644 [Mycoplasmopsis columbina SF7]
MQGIFCIKNALQTRLKYNFGGLINNIKLTFKDGLSIENII